MAHIRIFTQSGLGLAAALAFGWIGAADALDLSLPHGAQEQASTSEPQARYALPTGVFADGVVPSRIVEGTVTRSVWQIPQNAATTAQIFASLLDQLATQGYEPVVKCVDIDCGGFDFRFGIEVAEAPTMFVDLSDYQFASLTLDAQTAATLLVSTPGTTAYIQLIQIAPPGEIVQTVQQPLPQGTVPGGGAIGEVLAANGASVLADLEFATGASELTDASFASLSALADWLTNTPTARVILVGHTDAEGALEGNIALSKRRAAAVVSRLVDRYGINPAQLSAEGVGFLAPHATNATPEGRTINRRVEVVLVSQ